MIFARTIALALIGASLFEWLQTPLPWLLGPLLFVASARMLGVVMHCPIPIRASGQWVIGVALGLYFTPTALAQMQSLWWSIGLGLIWAWVISLSFAWLLNRVGGLDPITAFFSGAVGGASEMAIQAERHRARVEVVAAIHSLRVLIVVVSLPFAYRWLDLHGVDPSVVGSTSVDVTGLGLLVVLTVSLGVIFHRFHWPNAWMLGPLVVTVALTASGIDLSGLPDWVIKLGQVFIGMALGSRFRQESMRQLRSISILVVLGSAALIILSGGFAVLIANFNGVPVATMVLATSPGGIAEMSLTAKILQLGVPVVTVFHVTRLAFMVLTVGPVFYWLAGKFNWAVLTRSYP